MTQLSKELNPTKEALAWSWKNKWYQHPEYDEATRIAFRTHEYLCALCYVEIDSEEYYREINAAVNKYFPGLARLQHEEWKDYHCYQNH
ncbi:hypothetical protein N8317_03245 [Gammaproteobacteria bacterium]|nr:hypothetical protein [Gammaproteobacteria bacterium]